MRESPQALRAFALYRDLGPYRSFERLHKTYPDRTPSVRMIKEWSRHHQWQERCRVHDQDIVDESARRDRDARLADMEQRRQDRLKVAAALRGKGIAALTHMDAKALSEKAGDVVRMLDQADRTERLDYGQPTERIDVTQLSDDDIDRLIARHTAAGERTSPSRSVTGHDLTD